MPDAPRAVRWITRRLEEAGHETWAVGGAVRDACLGWTSSDWDLTTHARPEQVRRIFRRTVPIGIEHGTVGVLTRDGTMFDVTTFRRDVETDGRHAVVAFAETLDEDLARRDFTINAIAWHAVREELRDPFDGAGDLERGVLRTVGDPVERFAEDYLRVLRALRFAGRFRLDVHPDTWNAATAAVDRTPTLSAERIREELVKVLDADADPTRALGLYLDSGALRVLYPELHALAADDPGSDGWTRAVAAAAALPRGRPYLRLAALLTGVPPEAAAAVLVRLKLSKAQADAAARVASAEPLPEPDTSDVAFRRWLSRHGPEWLSAIARVQLAHARAEARLGGDDRTRAVVTAWLRARRVRRARSPLSVGDLALDGRALIALGLRPGRRFGEILDGLLDWVLEDPERNRADLLAERVRSITGAADG